MPVWVLGVLWMALNITYALTGQHPTSVTGWVVIGVVVLAILVVGIARLPPVDTSSSSLRRQRIGNVPVVDTLIEEHPAPAANVICTFDSQQNAIK